MNIKEQFKSLKKYLNDVWIEANPKNGNVVWPTRKTVGLTTIAVIVTLAIASAYIGSLDYIFGSLLKLVIG
jgi:preprotein translocase SecE subunit